MHWTTTDEGQATKGKRRWASDDGQATMGKRRWASDDGQETMAGLGQGHSVIVVPSVLLQPNVHSFQTSSAERVASIGSPTCVLILLKVSGGDLIVRHVVLAPELAKLLPKNRLFLMEEISLLIMGFFYSDCAIEAEYI
ncbi:hypothetical protein E6C27_scaffold174G001540 [Cucumis melo var. makuwa]|uniref:Uncharacterized protein n=1 Tax=Cucumis melo var. makuwa TaxID=1194695 RepID=A0A5A7U8L0_CUCMM|nr:hypothetical protein E6C27_scaffold174G001540 [Cucumis melo var. makuwa]